MVGLLVGVGFVVGYLSYPTGVFLPILPFTQQGCSFPFSLTLPLGGRRSAGLRIRPASGGKFRMFKSRAPDVPPYPLGPLRSAVWRGLPIRPASGGKFRIYKSPPPDVCACVRRAS